jgi:hypothetical protein
MWFTFSLGSLVSIVTNYGLETEVRFPAEIRFSSSPYVQTGSEAYPASYPKGTGGPFPGGKAAGA